jgi:hypothetical protein
MASFKFLDDVTLFEIIDQSHISRRLFAADQISQSSHLNLMKINIKKTKEMLLGSIPRTTRRL